MEINYGLVVKDVNDNIVHFVAYEYKPTIKDAEDLRYELSHDKEFGLTEIINFLSIEEADDSMVEKFSHIISENLDL